jgi:type IV pilus assembly protein PilW
MTEGQTRMNEDAQAALSILAQQLRMAGNNPAQSSRVDASRRNPVYGTTTFALLPVTFTPSSFIVRGCDGKFANLATTGTTLDTLTACGTSTLPDSIAINYEADRYNTVPTTNSATDCVGNGLTTITATFPATTPTTATSGTYTVADNRFYIGTTTVATPSFTGNSSNIIVPSLYCKGNGGTAAQPLVENVEDMQFTYGTVVATATTTAPTATTPVVASIAGYLDAATVEAQALWPKVTAVRVCVLVRSEKPLVSDANSARYDDCLGNRDVSAPDLRLRRAYSTTVTLRNRTLWLP